MPIKHVLVEARVSVQQIPMIRGITSFAPQIFTSWRMMSANQCFPVFSARFLAAKARHFTLVNPHVRSVVLERLTEKWVSTETSWMMATGIPVAQFAYCASYVRKLWSQPPRFVSVIVFRKTRNTAVFCTDLRHEQGILHIQDSLLFALSHLEWHLSCASQPYSITILHPSDPSQKSTFRLRFPLRTTVLHPVPGNFIPRNQLSKSSLLSTTQMNFFPQGSTPIKPFFLVVLFASTSTQIHQFHWWTTRSYTRSVSALQVGFILRSGLKSRREQHLQQAWHRYQGW